MQNRIFAAIAITIGLGLGGCALWVWQISREDSPKSKQTSQVADDLSAGTTSTLPATAGNSAGTLSDTSQTPTRQAQNTTGQNQNKQSSSSDVTFDPAQFSRYDKYVNDKAAVYATISNGNSISAEAISGKKVTVNYRGWLTNGKVFDENVDDKKPFSFTLGTGQVIAGWDQAISGMKVGGERLIIIPPAVGYGPNGNGPIPGNAVLVFDVKVVAVE